MLPYSHKSLNVNDIESIDVLKDATASTIYGCMAARGVVVITTKQARIRKLIIKDFLDGSIIPRATVSFISADKKDTVMMAANDSGAVITDKLKASLMYEMSVSAIGYKQLHQAIKNSNGVEQQILLEKDVKNCGQVVLIVFDHYRRCRCYGCMLRSIITCNDSKFENEGKTGIGKIFPNPVQKGKTITIETTTQSEGPVQIKITGVDGKLLLSQPQKAIKGLNRFTVNTDPRWSAGIYFIQLYANGKLLASDKVVIQ